MINIKIDSRKVQKGDTYVAIKGHTVDGHNYVLDAIRNGATTVVVDHMVGVPEGIKEIIVDDTEKALTNYLVKNYSDKINEMNLIGITGTNGKTTTAYLTYQMLNELGERTAYIGTIGCYIPGLERIDLPNTTPNILDLYDLLLTAKSHGCTSISMEVSSQGIDMGRTAGLKFQTGLFTNLTQDHLDYHKTMENYLDCKLRLLKQLKGNMILNADDKYTKEWEKRTNAYKTFGKKGSDLKLLDFEPRLNGTVIKAKEGEKTLFFRSNLCGEFNVYNYLGTLMLAEESGVELEDAIVAGYKVKPPKGRCEIIEVNDGIAVIDYAHTPDAMQKIIDTFRSVPNQGITVVFGCGGDRDATKRPMMSSIATGYCDQVVFTSDNPRTESQDKIFKDMAMGIEQDNARFIENRKEAIESALDKMIPGEVVLILGKGHEDYQIIGREKHHFDDREIVENYIKNKEDVKKKELKK